MKTLVENEKQTFDIALAEQRMKELKSKDSKLKSSVEYKTQQAIQKLIQIILRNVTISKDKEISVFFNEDCFTIQYIYNKEKDYSYNIKINFVKKSDIIFADDDEKERLKKNNIKIGDIKLVEFHGISIGFFDKKDEGSEKHFEYISIQTYIANDILNGGEFYSTLKFICDDLRDLRNQREAIWEEHRELNHKKEKHLKNIYEQQIRNSNYFKEGNFIVVRNIKKDFVEASVYEIGKVQKTTFYNRNNSIEIEDLSRFNDKKQLYALSVRNYRREEKRQSIDTFISIWASALVEGNKIEVLSTEAWERLEKDIDKERDKIRNRKLDGLSESYRAIKYKKED